MHRVDATTDCTHAYAYMRTHVHAHARAHTHARTYARARTHKAKHIHTHMPTDPWTYSPYTCTLTVLRHRTADLVRALRTAAAAAALQ